MKSNQPFLQVLPLPRQGAMYVLINHLSVFQGPFFHSGLTYKSERYDLMFQCKTIRKMFG